MLRSSLEQYEKALEIRPDDFESLVEVSSLYRASGQTDEAKDALEKALEQKPNAPEALTALAAIYLDTGEADKGVEALEKAMRSGNGDRRVMQMLGAAYERAGRAGESAEVYQGLLDAIQSEGGNTLSDSPRIGPANLLMSGDLDGARKQYELLLEARASHPPSITSASRRSTVRRGVSPKLGTTSSRRASSSRNRSTFNTTAVLLSQADEKTDDAIETLRAILDRTEQDDYSPRDRANRVMFLEHLGSLHRQKDDLEGAIAVYEEIGEINPRGHVAGQGAGRRRLSRGPSI